MTLAVLVFAVLLAVAAYPVAWRRRALSRASTAAHFMLTPTGSAVLDIEEARTLGTSWVNQLLSEKASLVIHRWVENGTSHTALTVTGTKTPAALAQQVARKVGATVAPVDSLLLPEVSCYAVASRRERTGRTALGEDLGAYADEVLAAFEAGDGDAFTSVSLEPMRPREVKALRAWLYRYIGDGENASTHPYIASGALTKARVVAGANNDVAAQRLASATLGFLPGFDTAVVAEPLNDTPAVKAGAVLAALGVLGVLVYGPSTGAVALAVTGIAVAAVALSPLSFRARFTRRFLVLGIVPVPLPGPVRKFRLREAAVTTVRIFNRQVRQVAARKITVLSTEASRRAAAPVHPMSRGLLPLSPHQVVAALAMPTPSGSVEEVSTTKVPAPANVTRDAGALLGFSTTGSPVYISDYDREGGVFCQGNPGKGKTLTLLGLFAADLVARKDGYAGAGAPLRGGKMSHLWLDSKADGAMTALTYARNAGYGPDQVLHFQAASTTGPRLELLNRANPESSARLFVDALTYALPSGSIAGASKTALIATLTLALAAPKPVLDEAVARGYLVRTSPIEVAFVLMGGRMKNNAQEALYTLLSNSAALGGGVGTNVTAGQEFAEPLAEPTPSTEVPGDTGLPSFADLAAEPAPGDFSAAFGEVPDQVIDTTGVEAHFLDDFAAVTAASQVRTDTATDALRESVDDFAYYMEQPARERRLLFKAPLNKLTDLRAVYGLWEDTPGRPTWTLAELVEQHQVAILDCSTGGIQFEDDDTDQVDQADGQSESVAEIIAALTMFLLRSAIRSRCSGWQQPAQRSVSFYCDELTEISGNKEGSSDDVVSWMFNRGRSYGVQMNVATQRWSQLPAQVSDAVRHAGTLVYLGLGQHTAADTFDDLSPEGSPFTVGDLANLQVGEAICRTRVAGTPQRTPFTLLVPEFGYPSRDRLLHPVPHVPTYGRKAADVQEDLT